MVKAGVGMSQVDSGILFHQGRRLGGLGWDLYGGGIVCQFCEMGRDCFRL